MLTYLMATKRDLNVGFECLRSIKSLPPHDHEVIICAPQHVVDQVEELPDSTIKLVVDEREGGSTYAFNKAYKHSSGDWVTVAVDDNVIKIDILRLLGLLDTPEIKLAEYQIYNLGGGWFDHMRRAHNNEGLPNAIWSSKWTTGVTDETFDYNYPVISFPLVSRKTIEEKLGGIFFNESLKHHYVDHWIGAWLHKRAPYHNPNIYSSHACWHHNWEGENNCDRTYDMQDGETYVKLMKHLIQIDPGCSYNVIL